MQKPPALGDYFQLNTALAKSPPPPTPPSQQWENTDDLSIQTTELIAMTVKNYIWY